MSQACKNQLVHVVLKMYKSWKPDKTQFLMASGIDKDVVQCLVCPVSYTISHFTANTETSQPYLACNSTKLKS